MDSPPLRLITDSGLLRLITDGPTSIWIVLLRLITDGPTDKSSGLRIRILRTPDPGPFFGPADVGLRT